MSTLKTLVVLFVATSLFAADPAAKPSKKHGHGDEELPQAKRHQPHHASAVEQTSKEDIAAAEALTGLSPYVPAQPPRTASQPAASTAAAASSASHVVHNEPTAAQIGLYAGAKANSPQQIQLAVQQEAHLNYVYADGSTALTTAITNKAINAALKLIELKANPNQPWLNHKKFTNVLATPLFLATVHILPAVVHALVEAGATVDDMALGVAEQAVLMGRFDKGTFEWMKKQKK